MRVIEHLDLLARLHYLFGIGQLGINAQFAILLLPPSSIIFFQLFCPTNVLLKVI